jgi:hypothetical protein
MMEERILRKSIQITLEATLLLEEGLFSCLMRLCAVGVLDQNPGTFPHPLKSA